MIPRANLILVFCVALMVSALGAPPAPPGDAPVVAKSGYSALSPSARLGITFSPPAKESEGALAAPQPVPVISPGPVAPGTVVLAPYRITMPRMKLTERNILTDKGRLALAEKQQITPLYRLTFGPLSQLATYYVDWLSILGGWQPNSREAMALYRQEERLKMLNEMDSLIRLETIHDPKVAKEFKRIRFGADMLSR